MRLTWSVPLTFIFTATFTGIALSIIDQLLFQTLLACIVLTESAPYSADVREEAFDALVRSFLQAGESE